MTSVRYLFTSLSAFGATVSGIGPGHSYDLNTIPDKISQPQLPCLIPYPEKDNGAGFSFLTMMGNMPKMSVRIPHLLLYSVASDPGVKRDLPGLLVMLDNYISAASAYKWLDTVDTSGGERPWQVAINFVPEIAPITYADIQYHSIMFLHEYQLTF